MIIKQMITSHNNSHNIDCLTGYRSPWLLIFVKTIN